MYYTVIKHSSHLRTLEKCRKHSPAARAFYISLVFSNACRVLSQCNTRLRLLYLLNNSTILDRMRLSPPAFVHFTSQRQLHFTCTCTNSNQIKFKISNWRALCIREVKIFTSFFFHGPLSMRPINSLDFLVRCPSHAMHGPQ